MKSENWGMLTDLAVRVLLVGFCLAVWLPNLGCKEQQELLGVESAEAVVETAYDVVLGLAAALGMRATGYVVSKRRRNSVRPCPTACLGPCSFI
jgi:hypothetical protein